MKTLVISIFLFILAASAAAQNNARIEAELVDAFKDIHKYATWASTYDAERLNSANQVFKEKLLKYTKIPSTLTHKFSELDKFMHNATAEDGKLRIYSWDTGERGVLGSFDRLYQYLGADGKVYSRTRHPDSAYDSDSFAIKIFHLDTKNGRVYIVSAIRVGASVMDYFQSANVYKIARNMLKDQVKVIKTRSGLTDGLKFSYNNSSARACHRLPGEMISLNRKTRTLRIPVVVEDGIVTNRSISYRFNGKYFVKVG